MWKLLLILLLLNSKSGLTRRLDNRFLSGPLEK